MSIEEIRGKIDAYTNVLIKLTSNIEIHNYREVKRSNQFYDITIENERLKIKAWDLPSKLWELVNKILSNKIIKVYRQ